MKISKSKNFYVDVYSRHAGVTGSTFLNSIHWPDGRNARFLVDAGAAQGNDNNGYYNYYYPYNAGKLDFIILTHGHHDHQGLLPVVVRQGFHGPIFTHYATSNLMHISLYDSCSIVDEKMGYPICDRNEVERTLDMVIGVPTKRILKPCKGVKVVFYTNGHLVGAVVTLIIISCPGEEDITLIYTGDYKDSNIFFNVETAPKEVRNLNISAIFCESTYGDVDSTNPIFEKCLKENSKQAIARGQTIIFPAFSQGRCQEILYHIKMWKNMGIIPANLPVYLDGRTAQQFTTQYLYTDLGIKKLMRNFVPNNLKFVLRTKDRMAYRDNIMKDDSPKIIVSSGGMCSHGPVVNYINYYLNKPDALIHLLGYCAPDSMGHKLLTAERGETVKYNGKEQKKLCYVARTSEMSSHAPRNKLLQFINQFPYTQSIIINHGETETKKKFREYLLDHLPLSEEMIAISGPGVAFRIESSGITDIIETNYESIL